jgi:hypothetical protein
MADIITRNVELALWERWPNESSPAFEAFTMYREMGAQRSLVRVGRECGKNVRLMERWSIRWRWQERAAAWDHHEARLINERILNGTAEMRQRLVNQALALQVRAHSRLLRMSDAEIAGLSAYEICLLLKTGADIETKARDIDPSQMGFDPGLGPPVFEIQVIRPGFDKIGVQLPDGGKGYISASEVDRFRRENPGAAVLI